MFAATLPAVPIDRAPVLSVVISWTVQTIEAIPGAIVKPFDPFHAALVLCCRLAPDRCGFRLRF